MAKKVKELRFSVKNKVGVLAVITKALKDARVNILHIAAWTEGGRGYCHMVTNNNARAIKALRSIGVRAGQGEVLVLGLRHRVGALDRVARKLAKANVNITCLSATSAGRRVSMLMNTKNNNKARRVV